MMNKEDLTNDKRKSAPAHNRAEEDAHTSTIPRSGGSSRLGTCLPPVRESSSADSNDDKKPKAKVSASDKKKPKKPPPSGKESKKIKAPSSVDVLCGRGKPFQNHSGNLEMRKLVDEYKDRYQAAPRNRKTLITEEILAKITESGGRFLKQVSADEWVPVTRAIAFEKVSHAFRSRIGGISNRNKATLAIQQREEQQAALLAEGRFFSRNPNYSALFTGSLSRAGGILPAAVQEQQQRLASSAISALSSSGSIFSTNSSLGTMNNNPRSILPSLMQQSMATSQSLPNAIQHRRQQEVGYHAGNSSSAASSSLTESLRSSLRGLLGELPGFSSTSSNVAAAAAAGSPPQFALNTSATGNVSAAAAVAAAAAAAYGGTHSGGTTNPNLLSASSQRAYYETLLGAAKEVQQQQQSAAISAAAAATISQQQQNTSLSSALAAASASIAQRQQTQQQQQLLHHHLQILNPNQPATSSTNDNRRLEQSHSIESYLYRQQLNELLSNLGIPPPSSRQQQPPP